MAPYAFSVKAESSCSMVDFNSPSCGCTARRSNTCRARSTSGMACARSSGAGRHALSARRAIPASLLLAGLPLRTRRAIAALATILREQRLVAHELVTVLLQDGAGEGLASHHKYGLAVFFQLVHQRDEVAVAADNGERVHVRMGESHLQRIQRQIDIAAVLVAARGGQALHHLHGVLRHGPGRAFLAPPVGVSKFRDQVAALLERIQRQRNIKFAPQSRFHADFNIVVIDKHGDVQFFLHLVLLVHGRSAPVFCFQNMRASLARGCFTRSALQKTV